MEDLFGTPCILRYDRNENVPKIYKNFEEALGEICPQSVAQSFLLISNFLKTQQETSQKQFLALARGFIDLRIFQEFSTTLANVSFN